MTTRRWLMCGAWLGLALWGSTVARGQVDPAAALDNPPALEAASHDELRGSSLAWLDERQVTTEQRRAAEALWQPDAPGDALDRLAATFALVDPRAAALVATCQQPFAGALPDLSWLKSDDVPPFVSLNMRLYYARWLAHQRLFDELLEVVQELPADEVADPSALLFYTSVAHHRLLHKAEGLRSLQQLLSDVAGVPQRFKILAGLMRTDLEALEDETLDHIARRMDDIRRRLDLGRAGQKVVRIEKGVIDSLDKLIEEMEKQQQQQQGGGGGASGSPQPSGSPMQDSRIAGGKGPGETDRKRIGNSSGWGDLPPKERQEALQQIGKDFPSHYRDVIEQYFRKLASEGAPPRQP